MRRFRQSALIGRRDDRGDGYGRTGSIGLASALPRSTQIYRSAREFGRATEQRIGRLYGPPADHRAALGTLDAMASIFPPGAGVADPWTHRVHEPIAILHYASVLPRDTEPRYLVQHADSIPSFDCVPLASKGHIRVFVRDTAAWLNDRATIPPMPADPPEEALRAEVHVPATGRSSSSRFRGQSGPRRAAGPRVVPARRRG